MDFPALHDWDLTPTEAVQLQKELAGRVDTATPLPPWTTLAAADVSFDRGGAWIYAAVVVVEWPDPEPVEVATAVVEARFPYIPGLLSFREAPGLLDAFRKLERRPDLILCDGQGIAHPRRLGIASHLGLWLDLPTIGCAKSLLTGQFVAPGVERGDRSPLTHRDEVIGEVVRTRRNVKPLFVSPGHRCDRAGAVEAVLATATRYRLPDPARRAHDEVNTLRRRAAGGGQA